MTLETVFLGHDNKRDVKQASELVPGVKITIGKEIACPRCGFWTYFLGNGHGKLQTCGGKCGLRYGLAGTAIRMTDEKEAIK